MTKFTSNIPDKEKRKTVFSKRIKPYEISPAHYKPEEYDEVILLANTITDNNIGYDVFLAKGGDSRHNAIYFGVAGDEFNI
jgi:hypothetical protein